MRKSASELARQLSRHAEAVCRRYLSRGRREGRYWLVGDVRNTPGRSLYVRLDGADQGGAAAGKWTDAATGEHGDLLDLIALNQGFLRLADTLEEARRFLALPVWDDNAKRTPRPPREGLAGGRSEAARRLFARSKPIRETIAQAYLLNRGLTDLGDCAPLRFHPHCFYRPDKDDAPDVRTAWPAMIAAVTDLSGRQTGAHRTWLDPTTFDKAPVSTPRRAMGNLMGHGVRFGTARDAMAAGEGIETLLSLRAAAPALPVVAALSSAHLAALILPPSLRRLYIARDNDDAGENASRVLTERAWAAGIETIVLSPMRGDFNEDLRHLGRMGLIRHLRSQFMPQDGGRFLRASRLDEPGQTIG